MGEFNLDREIEGTHVFRQIVAQLTGNGTTDAPDAMPEIPDTSPEISDTCPEIQVSANLTDMMDAAEGFHLTDLGNAERFIRQHGQDVRYCALSKLWSIWDGARWATDVTQRIKTFAQKTVRSIYVEVEAVEDSAERKALARHATQSESGARLTEMLSIAQSLCPVTPNQFDTNPWLLNVKNGTVDLRTGDLWPARRADLITKQCPVVYDSTAQCPTWLAFLTRAFNDNEDLIKYVQTAVGYSLTGVTTEECLFFLYGIGRNGKSKFLAALSALLGDYGQPAAFSTFAKNDKDRVRDDIADLDGARLVTTIEANAGRYLDEAQIKSLTGGDAQRARFLFGRQFTFTPRFKLWLAANHKPVIQGTDLAIWERIKLIPFTVTIPREERDKQLLDKFTAELPGILIWALEGCYRWQKEGMIEPDAVKIATEAYRTEMDLLGNFIGERCVTEKHAKAKTSDLFNAFVLWSGDKYLKQNVFGRMLTERGYPLDKKVWRLGICLAREETME
jgi:putative DNA primase/helicase